MDAVIFLLLFKSLSLLKQIQMWCIIHFGSPRPQAFGNQRAVS